MSNNGESVRENTLEWPYPVRYGKENEVSADMLVLGGGIAGCHAAINATKRGAKVVVDKAPVIRSGSGGAGIDHLHDACTNPCCKITPEEMMESGGAHGSTAGEYHFGHTSYITCKESWETLLDLEKMGVRFRSAVLPVAPHRVLAVCLPDVMEGQWPLPKWLR